MTGCIVTLVIVLKAGAERLRIPALVSYILLGFALRVLDARYNVCSEHAMEIFEFLAKFGVITLLFRIGLESNIRGLLQQLRHASFIWVVNVAASLGLSYGVASVWLGLEAIPSLFIAIALTATSVGISVGVWHAADALESSNGELLVDVAELDDISSIIFMALLFAVVPILREGTQDQALFLVLLKSGGMILLKLLGFGLFCVVFSLYVEEHVTRFIQKIQSSPEPMLMVVSLGIIMGAFAGLIGFSVAIGAFFAGLVFSRDPEAVHFDASFSALYELFSPFFFIGIGLKIDPGALSGGMKLGAILLLVAVVSKIAGVGAPALVTTEWQGALLLGVSMIPRAEIAMIVMQRGVDLGAWAVPPQVYAAAVLVAAATCLFSPLLIRSLLQRWPQTVQNGEEAS
ncbi:cation:proton antiporter [candidate division KSB3 bacterium]|uniref:Cation:proton antiporter n=1 Tax=candidate division KSB3 bacterium TaxID=2044937 RepID=A0A9D5JSZ4_9BACT|nr:cation:proton antiporter [candidate division KSB3 bacterium]